MSHTKRTPEFSMRISRLSEKLTSNTLDQEERGELAFILQAHTTDSPCIVKAADNEPIFVLRAQDDVSDVLVEDWALRFRQGHPVAFRDLTADESYNEDELRIRAKNDDALQCAEEMERYPGRKVAD